MDPRWWTRRRWPLALVGMALMVAVAVPTAISSLTGAVEFREDRGQAVVEASPVSNATARGPVSDGSASPIVDFVARNGTVTQLTAPELVLGDQPHSAVVVAFPVIPGNPACVGDVFGEFTIVQATFTEVGAFGATVRQAAGLIDGLPVPADLLAGDQPDGRVFVGSSPARLRWRLTDVYRAFVTSGEAPGGAGFVIALAATSAVQPGGGVRFVSSESGANGPALTWTGVPGC